MKRHTEKLIKDVYYEIKGFTDYYLYINTYMHDAYEVYSFRNFKKNPQGFLLKAKKNKRKEWYYEMTNDAGQRCKVTVDQIIDIIENTEVQLMYDYPPTPIGRRTIIVSDDKFDYSKTPIVNKRNTGSDKISTPLFSSLKMINPFEIVDEKKFNDVKNH